MRGHQRGNDVITTKIKRRWPRHILFALLWLIDGGVMATLQPAMPVREEPDASSLTLPVRTHELWIGSERASAPHVKSLATNAMKPVSAMPRGGAMALAGWPR